MGMNRFEWNGQPSKVVPVLVVLRGAGAAAPLVVCGPGGEPVTPIAAASIAGVSTTRAGVGDYSLVFSEKPGRFVGMVQGVGNSGAAAATAVVVHADTDSMTATGQTLRIFVSDLADAAQDLAATDEVTLLLFFRQCAKGM